MVGLEAAATADVPDNDDDDDDDDNNDDDNNVKDNKKMTMMMYLTPRLKACLAHRLASHRVICLGSTLKGNSGRSTQPKLPPSGTLHTK